MKSFSDVLWVECRPIAVSCLVLHDHGYLVEQKITYFIICIYGSLLCFKDAMTVNQSSVAL